MDPLMRRSRIRTCGHGRGGVRVSFLLEFGAEGGVWRGEGLLLDEVVVG